MRNITLFTVPKYFKPPFAIIQQNAIRSWLLLNPTPEIILCGDDEGVFDFASELGIKHIPDIKLSTKGTPLLDSVFAKVQSVAKNDVLAYVNSDIILMDDFLDTLDTVSSVFHHRFMIVGQRWDIEIFERIDFSHHFWDEKLRERVVQNGKLHPVCGIDYFVFEKNIGIDMLSFTVGRPGWDNWFLLEALRIGLSVVDATEEVFVVHQNHDYSHMGGLENRIGGEEAKANIKLAKGKTAYITRANWKFLNGKLIKK